MASGKALVLLNAQALTGSTTGLEFALNMTDVDHMLVVSVSAIGAATSLVVKVQHSQDGTDWFDVAGLTAAAITSAPDAKLALPTAPGILMHRVRAVATFTGGVTTATVTAKLVSRVG